jgi:hypothetical protein
VSKSERNRSVLNAIEALCLFVSTGERKAILPAFKWVGFGAFPSNTPEIPWPIGEKSDDQGTCSKTDR